MSPFVLATIVEGDGEVRALPVLIRRLRPLWQVPNPIRLPRTKAIDRATDQPRPDVLARYLAIARARVQEHGGRGAVLLLNDSDDSCAATLGPRLRQQAESSLAGLRCQAVLACREFEAWFLAAGIVDWTGDPESPRDAKGIVARALGYYSPTADQARLAASMDLDRAAGARSFRHLLTALDRLEPGAEV